MKKFILLAGILITSYAQAVTMPSSQAKSRVNPATSEGVWPEGMQTSVSTTSRAINLATFFSVTAVAGTNFSSSVILGFPQGVTGSAFIAIAPSSAWPGNDTFSILISTTITGQIRQVKINNLGFGAYIHISPVAGSALPLTVAATILQTP